MPMPYGADIVRVSEANDDGTWNCRSVNGKVKYENCVFLNINYTVLTSPPVGKKALLIQVNSLKIIIGYIPNNTKDDDRIYLLDGETYLTSGKSRALILSPTGDIGIYNIIRNKTGKIIKTPKLVYNMNSEYYVSFEKMVLDLVGSGAGGNIIMEKDPVTGYMTYSFNGRGNSLDPGIRFKQEIKGTPIGMTCSFVMDVSPTPVGGSLPDVISMALPQSIQMTMDPLMPFMLAYQIGVIPQVQVSVTPTGALTISTGASGTGPTIVLDPISPYPIEIRSNVVGLASIKINQIGAMTIDAKGGIEINGGMLGLIQTLLQFLLTDYQTHIHTNAAGPTTPPAVPPVATVTKLTTIKGAAR